MGRARVKPGPAGICRFLSSFPRGSTQRLLLLLLSHAWSPPTAREAGSQCGIFSCLHFAGRAWGSLGRKQVRNWCPCPPHPRVPGSGEDKRLMPRSRCQACLQDPRRRPRCLCRVGRGSPGAPRSASARGPPSVPRRRPARAPESHTERRLAAREPGAPGTDARRRRRSSGSTRTRCSFSVSIKGSSWQRCRDSQRALCPHRSPPRTLFPPGIILKNSSKEEASLPLSPDPGPGLAGSREPASILSRLLPPACPGHRKNLLSRLVVWSSDLWGPLAWPWGHSRSLVRLGVSSRAPTAQMKKLGGRPKIVQNHGRVGSKCLSQPPPSATSLLRTSRIGQSPHPFPRQAGAGTRRETPRGRRAWPWG
ncbi:proline-rich protein 18 isoform X1 [Suricata suricatta]|uniref:proline-rich protein 18 isoform X1 n=1 Tax=Suricata suricatta TaxID=37032 RepID=UPI0011558936|nr:proline-rich protein 18 isoform X1 [Suricata suricatta]